MWLLIILGGAYAVYADSLVVAVLVGSLVIYRSRRPSQLRQRIREAWYQRAAAHVGEDE